MIAMLGLEIIGDDADWRRRHRDTSTIASAAWRRALHSGKVAEYLATADRYDARPRAWVARITPSGREFLRGTKDYREANEDGSRGVYRWYELREGEVYEVNAPLSWTESERYFCRAEAGKIVRAPSPAVSVS